MKLNDNMVRKIEGVPHDVPHLCPPSCVALVRCDTDRRSGNPELSRVYLRARYVKRANRKVDGRLRRNDRLNRGIAGCEL